MNRYSNTIPSWKSETEFRNAVTSNGSNSCRITLTGRAQIKNPWPRLTEAKGLFMVVPRGIEPRFPA